MSAATQFIREAASSPDDGAFIDHTSGYLALSPRKDRFTVASGPGFVSYKEKGKHLFSFGGIHAPKSFRAELLDRFLDEAAQRRREVIVLQLPEDQIDLFVSRQFAVNQMGSSCGIRLGEFRFSGTRRMKLRNKIKRARESGLTILEVGREIPDRESTYQRIFQVSDAWVKEKGGKELDFLVGEIGQTGQQDRRIFLICDKQSRIVGFITYVPVWGRYPGYLHDLTRRLKEAPVGAMELCNAFALERFKEERVRHLHFGFTPFIVDKTKRAGESRVLALLIRALGRYGARLYPAQSQFMYKQKWAPDIIEREYIAFRKFSPRSLFDVMTLTRTL